MLLPPIHDDDRVLYAVRHLQRTLAIRGIAASEIRRAHNGAIAELDMAIGEPRGVIVPDTTISLNEALGAYLAGPVDEVEAMKHLRGAVAGTRLAWRAANVDRLGALAMAEG